MTLDEAIKHCEEVAEANDKGLYDAIALGGAKFTQKEIDDCQQCAADHRQLAEWLTELKECREADVKPVKRGHWEEIEEYGGWGDTYFRCSICGDEWDLNAGTPVENGMKYCPNCGARMDGDTE